ncbi:MAG: hypothetical protein QOK24_2677 [Verrucomicrobiota bacterium]
MKGHRRSLPVRRVWRATPPVDRALGVALTALGLFMASGPDGGGVVAMATMPAVTLPVMWRRQFPLRATIALSVGCVLSALPTLHQVRCGVAIPAALLIVYSLASRSDRPSAVRGLVVLLAALVFLAFTDPNLGPGALVLFVPLCAGVWGAGRLVASRARTVAALRVRSLELERQREQTAMLAVEVERTRLTSELDGAVRERIVEIAQLAADGERHGADEPALSRATFSRIETAGRASLDEMRGLLGALRSDERAARAPRPTLQQLDELLARARAGRRVVDLDVVGERRPLPAAIELAAYRIVELALTMIDADSRTSVGVRLRFEPESLEIEIEGEHRTTASALESPLVAAREQATVRGGSFAVRSIGPARRIVCARLPLLGDG